MSVDFSFFNVFCLTCNAPIGPGEIIKVASKHMDHDLNPLQMPIRHHYYRRAGKRFLDRVPLALKTGAELVNYAQRVIEKVGVIDAYKPMMSFPAI